MPQYMISLRKADGTDGVGPARYITFNDAAGPETELGQDTWAAQIMAPLLTKTQNPAGPLTITGDILFFVHGFNVTHLAACASHLKTANSLKAAGWTGTVVSYDWPSDGLVFAYLPDRANARGAASALISSGIGLLQAKQTSDCTINVHVMAHSMGGFVTQQAFTGAYQDIPPSWNVAQLLFVAADVDQSVFSADNYSAKMFIQHAGRLTAYCNGYDKALMVSAVKRLDMAPRMGRVGLPDDAPQMMCEVNCSDLFKKVDPGLLNDLSPITTHCFYFDQPTFWRDVALTLAGGLDRNAIPTRKADPATNLTNRFTLIPDGVDDATYKTALARAATTPSVML